MYEYEKKTEVGNLNADELLYELQEWATQRRSPISATITANKDHTFNVILKNYELGVTY